MSDDLTHMDKDGSARMVDVSAKHETKRMARAEARVSMREATLQAIREANLPKGDVLSTARLAAIMAAKRTGNLIPLCHPLPLDHLDIDFAFEQYAIRITSETRTTGKTGVEMEALTAASVAALTIYDMAKAMDRDMTIQNVRLVEKVGGKSGHWTAEEA